MKRLSKSCCQWLRLQFWLAFSVITSKTSSSKMTRRMKNLVFNFFILTLTHPIGLPSHTPVAQKIADQRWLKANSAKNRYLFNIEWSDYRLVSVNKNIFSLISFVRISYKTIWLKTDLDIKTHWKVKAGRV